MENELASVHGYLCADGYVIINPASQKHKYYRIGLRNTCYELLLDFQDRFYRIFGVTPIIKNQKDRCELSNKEITLGLLKKFGSFYSKYWKMPEMTSKNMKFWLRSYFDCDGWVSSIKGKDRKIGLESINKIGLIQIQNALNINFKINSSIKKRNGRNIWSLTICGRDDLLKFEENIGFLHPKKSHKLTEAVNSYVDYNWHLPENEAELIIFLNKKGKINVARKDVRFNSIIKDNLIKLQDKLSKIGIKSRLNGPWKNPYGSLWYCLSIRLEVYKKIIGGEN